MGWDDVQKKQPRYAPHAHDVLARTWTNDFTNLALNPNYEKRAAPLSKRRNGNYTGADMSPGGFFGELESQNENTLSPMIVVLTIGALYYLLR